MDLLIKVESLLDTCNKAIEGGETGIGAFKAVRDILAEMVEEENKALDGMAEELSK